MNYITYYLTNDNTQKYYFKPYCCCFLKLKVSHMHYYLEDLYVSNFSQLCLAD